MKIFILKLLFMFGTFLDPVQYSAFGSETPHDYTLNYYSKTIKLWVDATGFVTRAHFPGSHDPCTESHFPHQRNFLIRIAEEEGFRFVAYIDDHDELLGVRSTVAGNSPGPDPTDTVWHIFYEGHQFRLLLNPITELELSINLVPRNLPRHRIRPRLAIVGGIEFYVFRNHDGIIVSAKLPPQ